MGKLVTFEKRQQDKPAKAPKPAQGEVVMFTGVRYERGDGEPGKPPASAGSKRKRV